jgi:two-component system chemotaxis sensor kinase CheA
VDSLLGQQEIVIKPLGKYLSNVKYLAGATILGNGKISLILDVNSLF